MRIPIILVSLFLILNWACKEDAPKIEINYTADSKDILTDKIKALTLITPIDSALYTFYQKNDFKPLWFENKKANYLGQQIHQFIENSSYYGLFPNDYHYTELKELDTTSWEQKEFLFTDAILKITRDIHWGRIPFDTVSLRADTIITSNFFVDILDKIIDKKNIPQTIQTLEPNYIGYKELKEGLKNFLDSVGNIATYEFLEYPIKDSTEFFHQLKQRLIDERILYPTVQRIEKDEWTSIIQIFQYRNGLEPDGKLSRKIIQLLNDSNWEKFIKIAITLDKMKQLPKQMPSSFVMVNLPAFELKVYDEDTLAFKSRTIVGLPATRSPVLNSVFTNYITYPQWTVPYSIVFGEIIPKIIKDPNYLEKERLMVMDWADNLISPDSIDWKKMNKSNFKYVIRQREGDDNSLGIMKFNFANKYSVYLHDTNARWLFSKSDRALSHGCIRVQEFMKLAAFLIKDENTKVKMDSVQNWLATQTKKVVTGFPKLPLYIRYYTCEGGEGKIRFFNDLYGDDKELRNAYFADKKSH